jgi:hypothetical protein
MTFFTDDAVYMGAHSYTGDNSSLPVDVWWMKGSTPGDTIRFTVSHDGCIPVAERGLTGGPGT